MPKAIWNGVVLAESDQIVIVEGNYYFPQDSVNADYFRENDNHTVCPWKGIANYYDLVVNGHRNRGAAWTYPSPKPAANNIKDHVAFWRGVQIQE